MNPQEKKHITNEAILDSLEQAQARLTALTYYKVRNIEANIVFAQSLVQCWATRAQHRQIDASKVTQSTENGTKKGIDEAKKIFLYSHHSMRHEHINPIMHDVLLFLQGDQPDEVLQCTHSIKALYMMSAIKIPQESLLYKTAQLYILNFKQKNPEHIDQIMHTGKKLATYELQIHKEHKKKDLHLLSQAFEEICIHSGFFDEIQWGAQDVLIKWFEHEQTAKKRLLHEAQLCLQLQQTPAVPILQLTGTLRFSHAKNTAQMLQISPDHIQEEIEIAALSVKVPGENKIKQLHQAENLYRQIFNEFEMLYTYSKNQQEAAYHLYVRASYVLELFKALCILNDQSDDSSLSELIFLFKLIKHSQRQHLPRSSKSISSKNFINREKDRAYSDARHLSFERYEKINNILERVNQVVFTV